VIGFLKRNIVNIASAIVALASIGLGVLGLTAMGEVRKELDGIRTLHGQFSGAGKKPLNDKTIEAERKRVETIASYYAALIERAESFDLYEPLPPPPGEQFFPEPTDNGRRQFRSIYEAQFPKLIAMLHGGGPPTDNDIKNAQEAIDEEALAAQGFGQDEDENRSDRRDKPSDENTETSKHPSGLITDEAARKSADTRAAIRKARGIYCYVDRNSLDESTRVYQGLSPRPFDMWNAQVSLWVQQDVIQSLARVNNAAAEELKAEGRKAWVGVLPVKELISIRVSDYLPSTERVAQRSVSGDEPAEPPADASVMFTKNNSTDTYEVVQFTLKMIINARRLPLIIDELCKDRFHTVLSVSYVYDRSSFENLSMEGRIYGSEPTIQVLMDFETIFFGELYRCMMPEAVLGAIGKQCVSQDNKDS